MTPLELIVQGLIPIDGGGGVFFYSDTFRVDSTRTHSHGGWFIVTPLELIVQGLIPIDGGGGGGYL